MRYELSDGTTGSTNMTKRNLLKITKEYSYNKLETRRFT